jgi:hypothetical protein
MPERTPGAHLGFVYGDDTGRTGGVLEAKAGRIVIPDFGTAVVADNEGRGQDLTKRKAQMSAVYICEGTTLADGWRNVVVTFYYLLTYDAAVS